MSRLSYRRDAGSGLVAGVTDAIRQARESAPDAMAVVPRRVLVLFGPQPAPALKTHRKIAAAGCAVLPGEGGAILHRGPGFASRPINATRWGSPRPSIRESRRHGTKLLPSPGRLAHPLMRSPFCLSHL